MLTRESDLWAAGQVASGPQVQLAGRARCARRPYGLDPLKIVVERAFVAASGLEKRVADRVGFPDFDVAGLFVHDHLDADVRYQSRRVVAPATTDVDLMLVEARECDKSHIDTLNLRAAVPFEAAAETCENRRLDGVIVGTRGAACYGDEHDYREVCRYRAFGVGTHHDKYAAHRMAAEYGNCYGRGTPHRSIIQGTTR
jgi:hypothetical protein